MSQMDRDEEGAARVDAPIVLVNDREAQTYLTNNELLEALYGPLRPMRLLMDLQSAEELFNHIILEDRPLVRLALYERFPHVAPMNMPDFMQSDAFYRCGFEHILSTANLTPEDAHRVRVIVVDEVWLTSVDETSWPTLPRIVSRHFPNATLFICNNFGRGKPKIYNQTEAMQERLTT